MAEDSKAVVLGDVDGIAVAAALGGFEVKFEFDRHLVNMMHKVEGSLFNQSLKAWLVPQASEEALAKMIPGLRSEIKAIAKDRESIFDLAGMTAEAMQWANGTDRGLVPKVSEYLEAGEFHTGEIVNANGRFAAQFKGYGKDNGVAFVTVHRTASLDKPLMKGDIVGIKYSENGLGEVTDRSQVKSMDTMRQEFESTLGKEHEGVTVTLADKILVAFDFNPTMRNRLERISGVEFDKEAKVFSVPLDAKDNVVRAVSDMRREYVEDGKEIASMKAIAETKIDGAKVYPAFTKDGQEHFGKVLEVGDRYVLQKGGMDQFKLHHRESLDLKTVEKGQNLSVKYNKGIGAVVDLDKQKEQNKAVSR